MLKFLIILIFIIPFCFINLSFWIINNILLIIAFFLIIINFYLNFWINISYILGCDIISYGIILLRVWICRLILIAREKIYYYNNYSNFFLFVVISLLILLILTFSRIELFIFYLFFESRLIPTFFLILGWGYQPERLQAGLYLLFILSE